MLINLEKLGLGQIKPFQVDENAEQKYGVTFWQNLENGIWESSQLAQIVNVARKAKFCFVDIGASNGPYTLILSQWCEVHAVEPDLDQFAALRRNVDLNVDRDIQIYRALIVSQGADFKLSPYSISPATNQVEMLPRISLEQFLSDLGQDRYLVKMDIEGGEWQILRHRSTIETLKRYKTELFLSPHVGFFSSRYGEGFYRRTLFRISVLRELLTLFRFARRASSIRYRDRQQSAFSLLAHDRVFRGPGWREAIHFSFE